MEGAAAVVIPILALSLLLAVAYTFMDRTGPWVYRLPAKAGSVLLISLAAARMEGSTGLIVALLLSAAGDGALVFPGRIPFLAGLVAFLLAHLVFAFCMVTAPGFDIQSAAGWQWGLVILLGLFAVLLVAAIWDGAKGMRMPALAYAGVILGMTSCAVLTGQAILIAGVLLFFASDAVLALETFRIDRAASIRRLTAPFVWWTYYAAQLLLSYGLLVSASS